ncbi:MAG: DMT family transporter [Kiloniellales bacterium]
MAIGRGEGLGLVLAGAGAASYAVSAVLTGLAYGEGINPMTLVASRFSLAALVVCILLVTWRRSIVLPRAAWPLLAGMVAGSLGTAIGYMSAIDYIPVSLAVLIFYTFPILVPLAEAALERRAPSLRLLLASLVGFAGLAFALGPDLSGLDWRGIAFGLLAAFSALPLFLCGRRLVLRYDAVAVAAHINLISLTLAFLMAVLGAGIAFPGTAVVWLYLFGVCGFFASAFMLQLYAVRHASAGSAAMVFNAEPLLTILIAWFFLGQALGWVQWLGVGLVFFALSLLVNRKG